MKVIDVARWFYKNNPQVKSNDKNGNIVIQKLCYYAQAMYLAVYEEPLFNEKILAWENGPVIEKVYKIYRYNWNINVICKSYCRQCKLCPYSVCKYFFSSIFNNDWNNNIYFSIRKN